MTDRRKGSIFKSICLACGSSVLVLSLFEGFLVKGKLLMPHYSKLQSTFWCIPLNRPHYHTLCSLLVGTKKSSYWHAEGLGSSVIFLQCSLQIFSTIALPLRSCMAGSMPLPMPRWILLLPLNSYSHLLPIIQSNNFSHDGNTLML